MFLLKQNKVLKLMILITIVSMVLVGCTQEEEGIVAKVDGDTITQEEYDKEFQVYKEVYERQLGEDALEKEGIDGKTIGESLKESIIEILIMEKIIEVDSQKNDVDFTEEELQQYIIDYKESIGGEESYKQFLQSNNISEDYFLENMEKELLVEKHKKDYIGGVTVSEEQIKSYYETNSEDLIEINASHILLGSEEEALAVIKRLDSGENFADLAKAESLHSVSAVNGGSLGYFGKGMMIPEFEEVAFKLDEGEISNIVKTEVGYHIIKVQDKKESFEELKDKTTTVIKEQSYYEYIQSLRDEASVDIYLD